MTLKMDGHIAETCGECVQGMDISFNSQWGDHPLLMSLAETGVPPADSQSFGQPTVSLPGGGSV